METVDWIVILCVVLILWVAGYAIYRSKKKGQKCIGCPCSGSCSGHCAEQK